MIKTQIQLENWQHTAIKKRAQSVSCSMSEFIRVAVTRALESQSPKKSLKELSGKYHQKPLKSLKDHDAGWADAIR